MLKVIPKIYDLSGGVALRGWRRRAIFFAAESRRPLGRCGLWRVARPVALQVRRVGSFFRPVRTLTKSNRADGPSLGRSQNLAFDRLAPTGRSRSECGRRVGSFFFSNTRIGSRSWKRQQNDTALTTRRKAACPSPLCECQQALVCQTGASREFGRSASLEARRSSCRTAPVSLYRYRHALLVAYAKVQ